MNFNYLPAAVIATSMSVWGQVPDAGTHYFESDFIGSSSVVYTTTATHSLVEGWTGRVDPNGNHGGSAYAFSNASAGLLSYRGGVGGSSDSLWIDHPLAAAPTDFLYQVKFRPDNANSPDRADFFTRVGGEAYYVDSAGDHASGTSGATAPFALQTDSWYILEVIRVGSATPTQFRIEGHNYTAPGVTVDWVYMDAAPPISNSFEMRVWLADGSRPAEPLVSLPGEFLGNRYCQSLANSTGNPATIWASGSTLIADNNFTLEARDCPVGIPGLFFFGDNQVQVPFGEGNLCIQGGITRLQPTLFVGGNGSALLNLDLTVAPAAAAFAPGVTTNFQFWYRDNQGGPAGFNLTDGLEILWQ
ncbi:MAG: hypothetical protein ACI9F9_001902 [Candidatus Paceibacteria bacterium]|jgi:hypothetical protein